MATFKDAVLTKKGLALLAKAQAGQTDIHFTKAASGSGSYGPDEKLSEKEGLKEPRQETTFERITVINDIVVLIRFLISSEQESGNLQEGYYVKEVGIFAEDPNEGEILYAIATAVEDQWDYMPPYNSLMPAYITMEFYTEVCNAENVTIVCSGTFMTVEDAEKRFEELKKLVEGASIDDKELVFEQAGTRENIASGEKLGTILGKIKRFFTDLKKVAFTGSYNDLINKPSIPAAVPEGLRSGYVRTGQKSGTQIGDDATAEGYSNEASGRSAHAGGEYCSATGQTSFAGGSNCTASAICAFAWGNMCDAAGMGAVSIGNADDASGHVSMATGGETRATGSYSFTAGYETTAENVTGFAIGHNNRAMDADDPSSHSPNNKGDAFVIGNGIHIGSSITRSNAFRATFAGAAYGLSAFNSSGADYAEFIKPWADGNPDNEDRVGYLVTVKDGGLYKADEGDYIAGITSGNPSVVGNADEDYYWRYERDEFDRIVWMDVPEMAPVLDGEGNPVIGEDGLPVMAPTGRMIENGAMKLMEDYDPSRQKDYVERKDRPEWDYVGMVGVLAVRDDGTCIPGRFCRCGGGGIATLATERGFDTYMVIERVTDDVVKVIVR